MAEGSSEEWSSDESEDYAGALELPDLQKTVSYDLINETEIVNTQTSLINQLSEEIGLTIEQSAQLLIKHAWDINCVIRLVTDSNELETLLRSSSTSGINSEQATFCVVCCAEQVPADMVGMDCKHFICNGCYREYLKEAVNEGMTCIYTLCPMGDCPLVVPEGLFKQLLPATSYERYKKFLMNSFVELNKSIKWCPAPNCTFAAKYPKMRSRTIQCECGYEWCFSCGNESHVPLTCEHLEKWRALDSEGMEDQWLLANTKICPGCNSHIQKNEGCMHMTCRCGHEFCWLCLGSWSQHGEQTGGFYRCNETAQRLKENRMTEEEKKRAEAAKYVAKYNHFFELFMEYKRSVRFAKSKKEQKLAEVQFLSDALRRNPFEFIVKACDIIIQARKLLSNSYAMAYFLTSAAKQNYCAYTQDWIGFYTDTLDTKINIELSTFLDDSHTVLKNEHLPYKDEVISLSSALESFLNNTQEDMQKGFPDIRDAGEGDQEDLAQFAERDSQSHWICFSCTFANTQEHANCQICQAPRQG